MKSLIYSITCLAVAALLGACTNKTETSTTAPEKAPAKTSTTTKKSSTKKSSTNTTKKETTKKEKSSPSPSPTP